MSEPMDAQEQYEMGLRYDHGINIEQSHEQAAIWYRKAADQGHGQAANNLGVLYLYGRRDGGRDYTQAAYWFTKAAQRGIMDATYFLEVTAERVKEETPHD